jgi:hypothetical protein
MAKIENTDSPVLAAISSSVGPLTSIFGDEQLFARDTVRIRSTFPMVITGTSAFLNTTLYDHPSAVRRLDGRVSGRASWPLQLSFIVAKDNTLTATLYYSGAAVVVADVPAHAHAARRNLTMAQVSSAEGAASFTGSEMQPGSAVLHRGIEVREEMKLAQVTGYPPRLFIKANVAAVESLYVVVEYDVKPEGLSAINPF